MWLAPAGTLFRPTRTRFLGPGQVLGQTEQEVTEQERSGEQGFINRSEHRVVFCLSYSAYML